MAIFQPLTSNTELRLFNMNLRLADQGFNRDWLAYYQAVAGRPPRETLLLAIDRFEAELTPNQARFAVDLGCGDGRDTVELLRRGWQVLAIDAEHQAIDRLCQRADIRDILNLNPDETRLETQVERFEQLVLPRSVDLINASFSLPFCLPEHFSELWAKITVALKLGGRFCGHLFGDRDSWATQPKLTHKTRAEVEALLQPFAIELLQEEEHPGQTPLGEARDWHLFHIVARRVC